MGGDPLIQSPSLGLAVDIVCHTGIQTGLYASEMIPSCWSQLSVPTSPVDFMGNVKLSHLVHGLLVTFIQNREIMVIVVSNLLIFFTNGSIHLRTSP